MIEDVRISKAGLKCTENIWLGDVSIVFVIATKNRIFRIGSLALYRPHPILKITSEDFFENFRFLDEVKLLYSECFRVVVGVRFIKHERVIYLQVKEGEILPGGLIDKDSISWVPVSPIDVDNWLEKHKYHTMRYESRSIDLDDLVAPKNYVLTGN